MWRLMTHVQRIFYPMDISQLVPAQLTLTQLGHALKRYRAEYFRHGFNFNINTTLFIRLTLPHLERQRQQRCHLSVVNSSTSCHKASCASNYWPPSSARPTDWRLCGQLGDEGSYVSEGICLPSQTLSHRIQHSFTMVRLAMHVPPDVEADMRACESQDVQREILCRQGVATKKV